MSIAGTSLNGIADVFERGLRLLGKRANEEEIRDAYEPVPLSRAEMSAMFEVMSSERMSQEEALRASERREHETLNMIRAALYPSDAPRADSNT